MADGQGQFPKVPLEDRLIDTVAGEQPLGTLVLKIGRNVLAQYDPTNPSFSKEILVYGSDLELVRGVKDFISKPISQGAKYKGVSCTLAYVPNGCSIPREGKYAVNIDGILESRNIVQ